MQCKLYCSCKCLYMHEVKVCITLTAGIDLLWHFLTSSRNSSTEVNFPSQLMIAAYVPLPPSSFRVSGVRANVVWVTTGTHAGPFPGEGTADSNFRDITGFLRQTTMMSPIVYVYRTCMTFSTLLHIIIAYVLYNFIVVSRGQTLYILRFRYMKIRGCIIVAHPSLLLRVPWGCRLLC